MARHQALSRVKTWLGLFWNKTYVLIGSRWFFWGIVGFFVFETVWIALSAIYPMLFDEEFHLGIIEIYSRQLSPFMMTQPPEAAFHGDITRYGSYLFHYLMSIPYWIVSHSTQDLMSQVLVLRLICIGFVVAGLLMWRKVLLRLNVSSFVTNSAIAVFILLPIVPFALSQINYDSLAFLLVPTLMYFGVRATESKNSRQVVWLWLFLALAPLSCLVKFTLLPIVLAIFLFIIFSLWRNTGIKKSFLRMTQQIKELPRTTLILLSIFLVLGGGLFIERYGTNLIVYKAIEPKCDRIHSQEECAQYTVWRRDTSWKQKNDALNKQRNDPLVYTSTYWAPHIFGDFFVVAAFVYDKDQPLEIRYLPITMQASAGTFVLKYGSWLVLVSAIIAIFLTRKYLWRHYRDLIIVTLLVLGIYSVSLWIRNYTDYLHIGTPTAAQGRYFVPLLIPVLAIAGIAYARVLKRVRYKLLFVVLVIAMLLQGGGVASYILYSNEKWYWPAQRETITQVNTTVKKALRTFIIR